MHLEDLERRVRELERSVSDDRKKRQEEKEHFMFMRGKRGLHMIAGRLVAFCVAYPVLVAFLWLTSTPRPWIHALTPAILVLMFTFVSPEVRRFLDQRSSEKRKLLRNKKIAGDEEILLELRDELS